VVALAFSQRAELHRAAADPAPLAISIDRSPGGGPLAWRAAGELSPAVPPLPAYQKSPLPAGQIGPLKAGGAAAAAAAAAAVAPPHMPPLPPRAAAAEASIPVEMRR